MERYRDKYFWILNSRDFVNFENRLVKAVQNNCKQKVKVLLELISEFRLDILRVFKTDGKTLLHTALLFQHNDMFRLITEWNPQLLLEVREKTQQTVLHLGVARHDHNIVAYMLNELKKTENGAVKVYKLVHSPLQSDHGWELNGTCMEAELPLSIAAWNTDLEIIDILISQYGAQLDAQNNRGENVFHTLVKAAGDTDDENRKNRLVLTFTHLVQTKGHEKTDGKQKLSLLLNTGDIEGYTPLTLAARLHVGCMYEAIINCLNIYKFLDVVDGTSNVYLYDITDVDSAVTGERSVMKLLTASGFHDEYNGEHFIEKSPIIDIIRIKWQAYRKYFYSWGIVHVVMCLAPVVFTYYSGTYLYTTYSFFELHASYNTTDGLPAAEYALVVYQVVFHAYAIIMLFSQVYQFVRTCRFKSITCSSLDISYLSLGNGPYHFLLTFFGISGLASLTVAYVSPEQSYVLTTITMSLGWIFTLYFTRGIKIFSFLTVIIFESFLLEVIRLGFVYILILVPFSSAMTIAFGPTRTEFNTFWSSTFSMFQIALGLKDLGDLDEASHPEMVKIVYVIYLVITYTLLLNILIALLSETTIRISSKTNVQWHLQKLHVILYIEERLIPSMQKKCGGIKHTKLFVNKQNNISAASTNLCPCIPKTNKVSPHYVSNKSTRYYLEVKLKSIHGKADNLHQDMNGQRIIRDFTENGPSTHIRQRKMLLGTRANFEMSEYYSLVP